LRRRSRITTQDAEPKGEAEAAHMIRNRVQIVTQRPGGQRNEQFYNNVYSIVRPVDQAWRIEFHYLDANGHVVGYGGASFPVGSVREINFLEIDRGRER
jgi:hypothetical protein